MNNKIKLAALLLESQMTKNKFDREIEELINTLISQVSLNLNFVNGRPKFSKLAKSSTGGLSEDGAARLLVRSAINKITGRSENYIYKIYYESFFYVECSKELFDCTYKYLHDFAVGRCKEQTTIRDFLVSAIALEIQQLHPKFLNSYLYGNNN